MATNRVLCFRLLGRAWLSVVLVVFAANRIEAQPKKPQSAGKPGEPPHTQIVMGDTVNPEESGAVMVLSNGDLCSGTLLTNEWVITAAHCQLDIATPGNSTATMGSQTSGGVYAVTHPSLDFALLRLATPFRMQGSTTGYRVPLYTDPTSSLTGKTLRCLGYGCNVYDPSKDICTGSDGTLRQAFLPVQTAPVDDYSFSTGTNAKGQGFAPGDSGCGCSLQTAQGWALAGVLKGPHLGRPENWRDWAMAYVNGTPRPLPEQWWIATASHPQGTKFLKRPLENGYNDSFSWLPCPGQRYSFSPNFSLELGQDFVSLSSEDGQSVQLTGIGTTVCAGQGRLTATIRTSAGNASDGLEAMPVKCGYDGPSSGPPTTNSSPAVAGVGNNVYFFAKSPDGRILYNRAQLGQAGLCWSEIDGDGRTDLSPAAGAVGNHVYVAIRGRDGQLYLNQADLGQSFGQWFPMHLSTDVAPAVAGVGNNVYFFAKTSDGRILYNRAVVGQGGVGWKEMEGGGRTDASPAAAAVGNHVYVVIKGLDGQLYLNQADLGQPFGQWFPMAQSSNVAPAVAGVGGSVYFFAKAVDGRILFNRAKAGEGGVGWAEVDGNGKIDSSPAAGAVGEHVFVVVKGLDGRVHVNQADLNRPFGQWF
jgi:hypothetical protein